MNQHSEMRCLAGQYRRERVLTMKVRIRYCRATCKQLKRGRGGERGTDVGLHEENDIRSEVRQGSGR
jgi:hypothetical protein